MLQSQQAVLQRLGLATCLLRLGLDHAPTSHTSPNLLSTPQLPYRSPSRSPYLPLPLLVDLLLHPTVHREVGVGGICRKVAGAAGAMQAAAGAGIRVPQLQRRLEADGAGEVKGGGACGGGEHDV